MTSSTPPAWAWLEEKYQPVSIDPLNLSVSDTLSERNDSNPDPTYRDCWPSERYPSDGPDCAGVQSVRERHTNLSVGAQNEHPEPETTSPADSCVASCGSCADTTCAAILPEGEMRNAAPPCAYYQESPTFPHGENSADVKVDSCPECGAVTDIEYGAHFEPAKMVDRISDRISGSFHIPFRVQEWMFDSLAEHRLDQLHDLIDDHRDLILEMARDRFRKGYAKYGSGMYGYSPEKRLDETLQELADAVCYLTSGPVE